MCRLHKVSFRLEQTTVFKNMKENPKNWMIRLK